MYGVVAQLDGVVLVDSVVAQVDGVVLQCVQRRDPSAWSGACAHCRGPCEP